LARLGSMHGYGIVLHIQRLSDDLLRAKESSLHPELHRIEESSPTLAAR
jgi:DNA-binding PadR family transcriptional regulator